MAVATQQALGVSRRPLRVGRIRYGLWWLDRTTAGVRGRARVFAGGAAAAGRELAWAAELSLRTTTRRAELARPEPWSDRKLLVSATVLAVCALAVATVLGAGMARWAMTESNSLLFAAAGAPAVGLVFLSLAYLVFASRRGCR
ncbi:hypothetical protein [Nocardiopsis tropica]|uniref:Uncharacterized protein n=1 Tax=Nocardiopsis tropica TaxID=109330 RepID=A0ABU7L151_9ACTN|nr:hypothetical protein [Nocardiopsis umidischolae]MEE2055290.1 hypothetical protein [Nocardiopsis umidischolae]